MAGKTENKNRRPSGRPTGRPKGKPRTAAEIAADARRTGRPGMTPEANATKLIALRLTPAEFDQFRQDARNVGMGMAALARLCLSIAKGVNYGNDISESDPAHESGNRENGKRG